MTNKSGLAGLAGAKKCGWPCGQRGTLTFEIHSEFSQRALNGNIAININFMPIENYNNTKRVERRRRVWPFCPFHPGRFYFMDSQSQIE